IIDPACSIVFENEQEEVDVMRRPPRNQKEPLFGRRVVGMSLLQGFVVLAVTLAIYGFNIQQGRGELEARTLMFVTLVIANLGLILTNRTWSNTIVGSLRSKNAALRWILISVPVFLVLVVYVPFLRNLFRFNILHPNDWLICLVAGIGSILWFEVFKYFSRHKNKRGAKHPVGS
ncbi:MAG: cation-translocating P-type ATPase C-terminal domain-containing protein, partial [Chloroflexi bacterium]|nr:cation-translocating P-type ATPase C-terminal domain-containing protein [Chloroflexota bacterium]